MDMRYMQKSIISENDKKNNKLALIATLIEK